MRTKLKLAVEEVEVLTVRCPPELFHLLSLAWINIWLLLLWNCCPAVQEITLGSESAAVGKLQTGWETNCCTEWFGSKHSEIRHTKKKNRKRNSPRLPSPFRTVSERTFPTNGDCSRTLNYSKLAPLFRPKNIIYFQQRLCFTRTPYLLHAHTVCFRATWHF